MLVTGPSVMVMLLTSCSVVACMVSILLIISFRSIPTLAAAGTRRLGCCGPWIVFGFKLSSSHWSFLPGAWSPLTAVRCQLCFAVLWQLTTVTCVLCCYSRVITSWAQRAGKVSFSSTVAYLLDKYTTSTGYINTMTETKQPHKNSLIPQLVAHSWVGDKVAKT